MPSAYTFGSAKARTTGNYASKDGSFGDSYLSPFGPAESNPIDDNDDYDWDNPFGDTSGDDGFSHFWNRPAPSNTTVQPGLRRARSTGSLDNSAANAAPVRERPNIAPGPSILKSKLENAEVPVKRGGNFNMPSYSVPRGYQGMAGMPDSMPRMTTRPRSTSHSEVKEPGPATQIHSSLSGAPMATDWGRIDRQLQAMLLEQQQQQQQRKAAQPDVPNSNTPLTAQYNARRARKSPVDTMESEFERVWKHVDLLTSRTNRAAMEGQHDSIEQQQSRNAAANKETRSRLARLEDAIADLGRTLKGIGNAAEQRQTRGSMPMKDFVTHGGSYPRSRYGRNFVRFCDGYHGPSQRMQFSDHREIFGPSLVGNRYGGMYQQPRVEEAEDEEDVFDDAAEYISAVGGAGGLFDGKGKGKAGSVYEG